MKIEKINHTDYKIYIFSKMINKDNLYSQIKEIIMKFQKRVKLKGFYRVIATMKSVGLFLHLIQLNDSFYKNTLDLKIEMDDEMPVYFKTDDYFLIHTLNTVFCYDGMFYGLVDDSFDKIMEKVEFGDFVFGDFNFLNSSCII